MKRLFRASRRLPETERCELCAAPIAAEHEHLWEPRARQVRCACAGCALIVPGAQAAFLRVPRRFERVELDGAAWLARFAVPVGVAALYCHADGAPVAGYPGAIGLVESELDAGVWAELCAAVPAVAALLPEVEALVFGGPAGGVWITGIDVIYTIISELRARRGVESGMFADPDAPAAVARVLAERAMSAAP